MENEIENVFENRKEFMIHLLKFLNDKPKGVELGEFFLTIMPSHGIENFQEILVEMENQKWINILETPNFADIGGLRIPTKTVKYTIAISGIEYLDKLNIIVDKFKVKDTKNKIKINGNIIGSNVIQDSQNLENILSKNVQIQNPVAKLTKNNDQEFWEKAKSVSIILGFAAAAIGLITKIMDLW
jgi:hypothetical protein